MRDCREAEPKAFRSSDILEKYGVRQKIRPYLDMILKHNEKINLVSRETSPAALQGIAADCLIPFEYIEPPQGRAFDIGPGAGFPSIVVQTAFSNLAGVLIERTRKKAEFLDRVVKRTELDIEVANMDFMEALNSEKYASLLREASFDYGFAKLVKPEKKLFLRSMALLKSGGRFIYYGPVENIQFDLPNFVDFCRYNYYLDENKQLRSISIFLKGD